MKINKLKINGFGKLYKKELELGDNINIIFGKNEAGKSTILKFIDSMLYGISKNKNGKDLSDFDRFNPWSKNEFSGKIEYTLDNGKAYEVYRDFKKKSTIIYNQNKEDISKEFKVDKSKNIDFFVEQTGIDESTFLSTAISEQEGIRLKPNDQNGIVQKISNLINTGDDNISYKKSFDKLSKLQTERVGTDRTSQRPLNKVTNNIDILVGRKKELELVREKAETGLAEKESLEKQLLEEKNKETFLKKLKSNIKNNRIKIAEVNVNKNLEKEYEEKIEFLKGKIDENAESNVKKKKINFRNYYIFLAIFILICIGMFVFNKNILVNSLFIIPIIVTIILMIVKVLKNKKDIKNKIEELAEIRENIAKEIKILTETKDTKGKEYREKYESLMKEIEKSKDDIKLEYMNKLNANYVLNVSDFSYEKVIEEIENVENKIHTIEFKLHTIKSDSDALNTQLEELSQIEEKLEDAENEKENLVKLNSSFEIAKECLENAYEKVKENISPRFVQNLSNIIQKISNNKYTNVKMNDTDGLTAEIETGEYLPVNRLSTGTIDQMYLSLRLSALKEISDEKMPIILDEAFAYFDNERLKNILKYISEEYSKQQVLIFTCSNREKEELDKLNISYKLFEI